MVTMSPVAHHRGCASIRICVDKLDVDTRKLVVTVPATKCEITWQVVYRISVLECTYEGSYIDFMYASYGYWGAF